LDGLHWNLRAIRPLRIMRWKCGRWCLGQGNVAGTDGSVGATTDWSLGEANQEFRSAERDLLLLEQDQDQINGKNKIRIRIKKQQIPLCARDDKTECNSCAQRKTSPDSRPATN
jgi:hypothetical protein